LKVKVSFFDESILKSYGAVLSAIGLIASLFFIFVSIPPKYKLCIGVVFVIFLVIIYFILWIRANNLEKINIKLNNKTVTVKSGDIFQEEGLKVIAFNEYFDTIVDGEIITPCSLNGKFINRYVKNVEEFNKKIEKSEHLSNRKLDNDKSRKKGNTQKYQLGSIYKFGEYLLMAFSRFDDDNRAFLTITDYINCLLNFWNEIDIIYANKSVVIPLLGTGITRFKDYAMTEQENLELLLWSLKVSRVKFTYPTKVTIVISKSMKNKINFYKLKNF